MRYRRPVLAAALVALAAVPGAAVASGPNLGTSTQLNAATVTYQAQSAGTKTAIRAVRAADGHTLRQATVAGAWGIPLVTINGDVAGLSRDGRMLVLSEAKRTGNLRSTSRFLVLDTGKLAVKRTISLPGEFGFDALSPNGRMLYLIEHHNESDASQYQVRAYDLKAGRLLDRIIVDKRELGEVMSGFPTARVASGDGRKVFTLYMSPEHPFVHLLDTVSLAAFCIDLPKQTSQQAIEQATMRLTNGGRNLTILGSAGAGLRHVVDTQTLKVS